MENINHPDKSIANKNHVTISEFWLGDKPYIRFDFKGTLTYPDAFEAIEEWKRHMTSAEKKDIIYNCLEMSGFESEARKLWQATQHEYKPKIASIWVVTTNMFILTAAKTMGLLTGYSIKVAKRIEEVG